MIEHYTDHAANERTFLAWVRTAIAVMAFGFLVERFDLFLAATGQSLGERLVSPRGQMIGNVAGLLLILLGGAMMVCPQSAFAGPRVTSRARSCAPAPGRGWTWPSSACSCCSARRYSSICPTR